MSSWGTRDVTVPGDSSGHPLRPYVFVDTGGFARVFFSTLVLEIESVVSVREESETRPGVMRWILAVVVGLTSVAADGVCEDTGSCNINLNKQQCCSLNLPIVKTCAANCCERLGPEGTEDPGYLAGCPNFFNVAGCECAAAEKTDGPTAEPTPAPTPCRP